MVLFCRSTNSKLLVLITQHATGIKLVSKVPNNAAFMLSKYRGLLPKNIFVDIFQQLVNGPLFPTQIYNFFKTICTELNFQNYTSHFVGETLFIQQQQLQKLSLKSSEKHYDIYLLTTKIYVLKQDTVLI